MDCTSQRSTLRVTVSGDFDKNAVRRMKYALGKVGNNVEQRHYFPKSEDLAAVAQFDVMTTHDATGMKAVLERISGVHVVTIGANDA